MIKCWLCLDIGIVRHKVIQKGIPYEFYYHCNCESGYGFRVLNSVNVLTPEERETILKNNQEKFKYPSTKEDLLQSIRR